MEARAAFARGVARRGSVATGNEARAAVRDYGVPKAIEHLPVLRDKLRVIADRYLAVQQDILKTFVDRGQLRALAEPTRLANGKRIPGLKLDHPRQLAVMHALVRFAHIAGHDTFTTRTCIRPPPRRSMSPRTSIASRRYAMTDLLSAGLLEAGMPLFRRSKKNPERVATLLADGHIEIDGKQFSRPSEAAGAITGHSTNGWWFFLVQQSPRRSLKDVWRDYVDNLAVDAADDDTHDDGDEGEG